MRDYDGLADRFEADRPHLRAVAYRMLSSYSDADDAVQEAWLRLSGSNMNDVANLSAWLQTILSRVCLDMLRSRKARREDPISELRAEVPAAGDPEQEALLLESVGRALLVVLDRLSPDQRIAFVLHDIFGVSFENIAPIVDQTPDYTKKIASRARQRVRGSQSVLGSEQLRQQRVVSAFLAAARVGDLPGLLMVLAPNAVRRVDAVALSPGMAPELQGAHAVAEGTVSFQKLSPFADLALVDGRWGVVVAPQGQLLLAVRMTYYDDLISAIEVIGEPKVLDALDLAVPEG
jgi:RNA polymerase sigma factor (sigma-70 family)